MPEAIHSHQRPQKKVLGLHVLEDLRNCPKRSTERQTEESPHNIHKPLWSPLGILWLRDANPWTSDLQAWEALLLLSQRLCLPPVLF